MNDEVILRGHCLSPGLAVGTLWIIRDERLGCDRSRIVGDPNRRAEVERFQVALDSARRQLNDIRRAERKGPLATILEAHLQLLRDPLLVETMESEIRRSGQRACFALKKILGDILKALKTHSSRTGAPERSSDFKDVCLRIGRLLNDQILDPWTQCPPGSIIACREMLPSVLAQGLNRSPRGLITQVGGENSHVAIMARAQGIPYLSRVSLPRFHRINGLPIIVDADHARILLHATSQSAHAIAQRLPTPRGTCAKDAHAELKCTRKKAQIEIAGNAESASQVRQLIRGGASAIGLFRSEVLAFKLRRFPSEQLQMHFYRELVEAASGHPLTVRLFDVGGDKILDPAHQSERSALGYRGIRYLLRHRHQLRRQLRALVSLSYRPLSILIPMVSSLEDLLETKGELDLILGQSGFRHFPRPRLGCMLEVPSATIILDQLAQHCDFFSLGTNDLCQYLFAMDRNQLQSRLHLPYHPAILRLIAHVAKECKRLKKPISICGELCSDTLLIPLLVGLGIRSFSVSPAKLSQMAEALKRRSLDEAQDLAREALALHSVSEIRAHLQRERTIGTPGGASEIPKSPKSQLAGKR